MSLPPLPSSLRRAEKSHPLLLAHGSWWGGFEALRNANALDRAEQRAQKERERKLYTPKTNDITSEYERIVVDSAVDPEPWMATWGRNLNCEKCWRSIAPGADRMECYLCPAVQHLRRCTVPSATPCPCPPPIWLCDGCAESLEDSVTRRQASLEHRESVRRFHEASLRLQRTIRMRVDQRRFGRSRSGIVHLQARARGVHARKRFVADFSLKYRPVRFDVLHSSPDARVIVTLMSSTASGKCEAASMFRQDIWADSTAAAGVWSPESGVGSRSKHSVKFPCLDAHTRAVFTVVAAPRDAQDGMECLGQASVNLYEPILFSRTLRADLVLGPCDVEAFNDWPRRLRGTKNSKNWQISGARRTEALGSTISVEVVPASHLTTHCVWVGEAANLSDTSKQSKRWFIVLDGSVLRFYSRPMDAKPRHERLLHFATVRYHKGGVVELRAGGEWMHLLTCSNAHDLRKLHSRLKTAIQSKVGRRSTVHRRP